MAEDDDLAGELIGVSESQLRAGLLARLAFTDRPIVVSGILGTLITAAVVAWAATWWQVALFVLTRLALAFGTHALSRRVDALGPEVAVAQGYLNVMDAWMAAVALSWASVIFFAPSPVLQNAPAVLSLVAVIAVESVVVLLASVTKRSILVVIGTFWACLTLRVLLDDGDARLAFLLCNLAYHLLLAMHALNVQRETERQVRNEIVNRVLLERVTQLHTRVRQHRDELARVNEQLQEALAQSEEAANHDHLTGVLNRRSFLDRTFRHRVATKQDDEMTALILLDLDRFKSINDGHGHSVGDAVLVHCAGVLRREVRANDVLARWGGEEFIVLMPNTTAEEALACAERLRNALAEAELAGAEVDGPDGVHVTASFGVATLGPRDAFHEALRAADAALYAAKAAGRNQVRMADTQT